METDWNALTQVAIAARENAYAPYSSFPVGAAAVVDDGRIISGCNVENASYGVTLCAECGLVSALHASGGGKLTAVVCLDANNVPLPPCGRCRQLLSEHAAPGASILLAQGVVPIAELMPHPFGADNLDHRR
jgi:cytidine deaminase